MAKEYMNEYNNAKMNLLTITKIISAETINSKDLEKLIEARDNAESSLRKIQNLIAHEDIKTDFDLMKEALNALNFKERKNINVYIHLISILEPMYNALNTVNYQMIPEYAYKLKKSAAEPQQKLQQAAKRVSEALEKLQETAQKVKNSNSSFSI